jgi:hypothetical protein
VREGEERMRWGEKCMKKNASDERKGNDRYLNRKSYYNYLTINPLPAMSQAYIVRQFLEESSAWALPHQIVYVVDSSAPVEIKLALIAGISWWDEAFQYAGYPAGTLVVVESDFYPSFDPYDFDPTSPRRHFVEWFDRDFRSFSVGERVIDPR